MKLINRNRYLKKTSLALCFFLISSLLFSCSSNLTDKDSVIKVFNTNEEAIRDAVEAGSFDKVEKLRGIQDVYVSEDYIDFMCGGSGFGPSTHYYGFFYSADDNLIAWNGGAAPRDELIKDGKGFKYEQPDGDNRYYVEEIGEHFFYYEAHF